MKISANLRCVNVQRDSCYHFPLNMNNSTPNLNSSFQKPQSLGKILVAYSTIGILFFVNTSILLFLSGCDKRPAARQSKPTWTIADLEINKYKGTAVVYIHKLNDRPPFYKGSMPLSFKGTETPQVSYYSTTMLMYEFKNFKLYFVYEGSILSGAVAVNNDDTLIGEAKFNLSESSREKGIFMEEIHFHNGVTTFRCISKLDPDTGYKISESNREGRKKKDYFFIIPW